MLYAIDGKTERTYTTPCGELNASGENYIDAIKPEFIAIKSGTQGGVVLDMHGLDPYAVDVAVPSAVSGQQLIDIVEDAARKGTMANLTFHGIGGDYLATSSEAHEELLQYLSQHPDIYWVDTFVTIMKYVKAHPRELQ